MLFICIRFINSLGDYSLDHIGYHLIELGCILGCNDRNTTRACFDIFSCAASNLPAFSSRLQIFLESRWLPLL